MGESIGTQVPVLIICSPVWLWHHKANLSFTSFFVDEDAPKAHPLRLTPLL